MGVGDITWWHERDGDKNQINVCGYLHFLEPLFLPLQSSNPLI